MAIIKHVDTKVIRSEAPLLADTRAGELLNDDKTWFKVGRYRVGLTDAECSEFEKHVKLMRHMREEGGE